MKKSKVRRILFKHRRALGDGLMFTAGIRDFKLLFPEILINVDSNQPALWKNNPYIDTSLKRGQKGVEYYEVGYPMVGNCNNTNMHFTSMFLFDMIAITDLHKSLPIGLGEFCSAFANGTVGDPALGDGKKVKAKEPFLSLRNKYINICENFTRQRGDIHLSKEEKNYNMIKEVYDIDTYWVIAPGGKRDVTTKIWDWRKFQEVIDYFEGRIKFVVIGKSDLLVEKLNGVINLVDKYNKDVRPLFSVVYHSDGCVSGPSFLMHLAGAMPPKYRKGRKPCVSIFGGREPTAWSWYCNHQILHTNGAFTCCDNGGCWRARTYPLPKDASKHNNKLCHHPIQRDGRTVQACMNNITAQDVIRAIEKYYEGNIYEYDKPKRKKKKSISSSKIVISKARDKVSKKEINLLGNLNSKGGGEQSLCYIAHILREANWKVHLYPWGNVNSLYKDIDYEPYSFKDGTMLKKMKKGLPLLFYGNDSIWDFAKNAKSIVDKSSSLIIGINFANGNLPQTQWLTKSKKLKAVIFQNEEKKDDWVRKEIGFDNTKKIVLFGAINLDKYLEVCTETRKEDDPFVVLKHCMPDTRKYVTNSSYNHGDKPHIWQQHMFKERDTKFYTRLIRDIKNVRFEFMEAPEEIVKHFKNEPKMVFHKLNSMDVGEFLKRGHIYLYRTSNAWRDQYPRVVAEALAAGLPVLTEPRDGTKDRVIHGDTGFYCIDFDGFSYALKLLRRKEKFRQHMGRNAKDWARQNLNPKRWAELIDEILYVNAH